MENNVVQQNNVQVGKTKPKAHAAKTSTANLIPKSLSSAELELASIYQALNTFQSVKNKKGKKELSDHGKYYVSQSIEKCKLGTDLFTTGEIELLDKYEQNIDKRFAKSKQALTKFFSSLAEGSKFEDFISGYDIIDPKLAKLYEYGWKDRQENSFADNINADRLFRNMKRYREELTFYLKEKGILTICKGLLEKYKTNQIDFADWRVTPLKNASLISRQQIEELSNIADESIAKYKGLVDKQTKLHKQQERRFYKCTDDEMVDSLVDSFENHEWLAKSLSVKLDYAKQIDALADSLKFRLKQSNTHMFKANVSAQFKMLDIALGTTSIDIPKLDKIYISKAELQVLEQCCNQVGMGKQLVENVFLGLGKGDALANEHDNLWGF